MIGLSFTPQDIIRKAVTGKTSREALHEQLLEEQKRQQIVDETGKNLEYDINANEIIQKGFENAKKLRDEQWAREDEIRNHVEEREDTAWTRSVKDMIRAGINPNLINATPAQSGGGITNSTGIDYTLYEKEFDKNLELLKQEIENNFKGSQAEKDRVLKLIQSIIAIGAITSK